MAMKPFPKSLVAFTLLSGLGAGLVLVLAIAGRYVHDAASLQSFELPALVTAFLLLCLAFVSSAVHLGRPGRAFNALANPRSMIAKEAYWGIALVVVTGVAMARSISGHPQGTVLGALGVLAAAGLLTVTALVYARARAIPTWNSASTLLRFWTSAALMGAVGCLLVAAGRGTYDGLARDLASVVLALIACQALIAAGVEIELTTRARDLELPRVASLSLARWVIGLLLPAVVVSLALQGSVGYVTAGIVTALAIVAGESFGRVIFFSRGVHV
jgi:DMSO reductase anchor subunit